MLKLKGPGRVPPPKAGSEDRVGGGGTAEGSWASFSSEKEPRALEQQVESILGGLLEAAAQ